MTKKFDDFKAALIAMCAEHGVYICPSAYDNLDVWDSDERYTAGSIELRDMTEEKE